MNAVVKIICYKQKTLKNGEHPIIISKSFALRKEEI